MHLFSSYSIYTRMCYLGCLHTCCWGVIDVVRLCGGFRAFSSGVLWIYEVHKGLLGDRNQITRGDQSLMQMREIRVKTKLMWKNKTKNIQAWWSFEDQTYTRVVFLCTQSVVCSTLTSVCMGPDGRTTSWKGTLGFWAGDCGGLTGVSLASLSEVWTFSSFSRKVSKLCSRDAVPVISEGGWFSEGLENSRCRALGEGRVEAKSPLRAFRRACRISHSFGETLLKANAHQKVKTVSPCNISTLNAGIGQFL